MDWLTPNDLAERFQIPLQTIYKWNSQGSGPPYAVMGKHVRYRREAVDAWAAKREAHADKPGAA